MSRNMLLCIPVALLGMACAVDGSAEDVEGVAGQAVTRPDATTLPGPVSEPEEGLEGVLPGEEDPALLDDELAQWRRGRWVCRVVARCRGWDRDWDRDCFGGRQVYFGEDRDRERARREALRECRRDHFNARNCEFRGCTRRGGDDWDDRPWDRDPRWDRDRDWWDDDGVIIIGRS